jgi:hypothetical protein
VGEEAQQEILEENYEPRAYSGRGMYGEGCLGVDLDQGQLGDMIADVMVEMATLEKEDASEAVADAFLGMAWDSVGNSSARGPRKR